MDKEFEMTLCYKCKSSFESSGENSVKRADPNQKIKNTCDFCNVRTGYDYIIEKRKIRKK